MKANAPALTRSAANERAPNRQERYREKTARAERKRKQACFLELLRYGFSAFEAAGHEDVQLSVKNLYRWTYEDPEFDKAWDKAVEDGKTYERRITGPVLEREADRRAVEGVEEPDYYQGGVVGYTKKYSDGLLTTRLKAVLPEKYRESAQVGVTVDNRTVNITVQTERGKELLGLVKDRTRQSEPQDN
ncbi:hypothetical protein LCGC14_0634340 [marine sediment metagenome]|uniref:Terminase small subunit n=1 Tax=marine sediment metagenome TaxID=412755 RepID=A0A0F9RKG2_9ZZZZ